MRNRSIVVAGAGVAGVACALALAARGARVSVLAARVTDPSGRLAAAGIPVLPDTAPLPAGTDLVVTSPGLRPSHPLLTAGVEVIGEIELAWRLRNGGASWLAVTGTNGKTTTVGMLEAILRAAGLRAVAAGNVGFPLVEAASADPPYDVIAVEASSFQLHFTTTMAPRAAAILNVVPDHLDWHGSMEAYVQDKARIYANAGVRVYNADDPRALALARGLPNAVGFTVGEPEAGQYGVAGDRLVDAGGEALAMVADVRPPGRHNVANALAAAALARTQGVPPEAVADGLRAYRPGPHRNQPVAVVGGVSYVDDSKATNPHAAAASLHAHDRVVWIAGGQLKGAPVDDLVAGVRGRLVGAVLLGADRKAVADAIARHAPGLPVVEITSGDDDPMTEVVRAAARLARPGDTVLLAPAAASLDMFRDYAARGDAFAAAVRALDNR